jgi:DNA-binding NtrC family response regulator
MKRNRAAAESRRPKALVVDDMRPVRETVCRILEEGGFQTEQAHDANEALRVLRPSSHDLVVTDLKMPGGDGMSLIEEMKRRRIDCPVIVLTSYGSFCSRVKAIAKGAFMHLDKPFKAEHLLTAAIKALDWKPK